MGIILSEEQVDDLLDNVVDTKNPNYWKNGEKLICCPVHRESNPSMGVSIDKQVCHCFSCGFAGDFAKLLIYSLPDFFKFNNINPESERKTFWGAYKKAKKFLAERYKLEYKEFNIKSFRAIKRYEENVYLADDEVRKELPYYKLAPYKSGKETYKYFFKRGFTKEEMKEYMIGRDLKSKTITIPIFYEDKTLAGIIGRYVERGRKKNQRYKIYDEFKRSKLLYPLDKLQVENGVIILVEGCFDVIRLRRIGVKNVLALLTNQVSKEQAEILYSKCGEVIWLCDNDKRGLEGREKAEKIFKNNIRFKIVDYPEYGKDVCDWKDEEVLEMISTAYSPYKKRIKRL